MQYCKCWSKVKTDDGKQKKIYEPCTIEHPDLAKYTEREIWKRVLQGKIQACTCGESLENELLHLYDHDGGYNLKGFGKPQWVYVECSCGYQWSVWKLHIDLSDLEKIRKTEIE